MHHVGLRHVATGLIAELHWRIGPRFAPDSLPSDELFARASSVDLLGRATPTLGRADSVLALTVHASKHEWSRLDDVATLCGLLRTFTDEDWRALRSSAAAHDCRRRLAVGLRLAHDLGGLTLRWPYSTLAEFASAERLAKEAEAFLFGSRPHWWLLILTAGARRRRGRPPSDAWSSRRDRALGILWQARVLDSPSAGLRHLWRRFSTSGAQDWGSGGGRGPAWLPGPLAQVARRQQRLWAR